MLWSLSRLIEHAQLLCLYVINERIGSLGAVSTRLPGFNRSCVRDHQSMLHYLRWEQFTVRHHYISDLLGAHATRNAWFDDAYALTRRTEGLVPREEVLLGPRNKPVLLGVVSSFEGHLVRLGVLRRWIGIRSSEELGSFEHALGNVGLGYA